MKGHWQVYQAHPLQCDAMLKSRLIKECWSRLVCWAPLQMFKTLAIKSLSHAWQGFKNPVLCKSNWLTCRERERVRRGKWKDRVHLLPGEGMGERFTDLWHTHRWSTQREPLCPWKIAAWPLFQLSLPLCNCHGWGWNTYTRTPALALYCKPERSKGRLTWAKKHERVRVHAWRPINHAQHHLCYVFAFAQTFWCVFV